MCYTSRGRYYRLAEPLFGEDVVVLEDASWDSVCMVVLAMVSYKVEYRQQCVQNADALC